MKKHLVAASSLLLAPLAMAQSSVNLFGVVDLALTHAKGSVADRTSLSSGNIATSRIGLRGVEDLGGGLRASFWLEAGLMADVGSGQSANTNNQSTGFVPAGGLVFNRRSTLSLSGNWGELRLGRNDNPSYWNLAHFDPFGHVGIGAPVFLSTTVAGPTNTFARASNAIHYITPGYLNGFGFWGSTFFGENPRNGAATQSDGDGYSMRLAYDGKTFRASVGALKTKYAAGDVNELSIGGSYTLGSLRLMGVWMRDEVSGAPPDGRGFELAAALASGPREFKLAYSTYRTNAPAQPKSQKLAAGVVHSLSKRTAVYGTVAHVRNSGGASQALAGAVAGANGRSTGFDVGIRHAF